MASSTVYPYNQFDQDQELWDSLKTAIATTSGFRCWQDEQIPDEEISEVNLEDQVIHYLRETLETLAY